MRELGLVLAVLVTLSGLAPTAVASHTERERFDFKVTAPTKRKRLVVNAPYLRHLDQFDSRAGWIDGDRYAYRCGYTFLQYRGELVARVTFTRIASYAVVNDKYMKEGGRFYEGSPTPPGTKQVPKGECPGPTEEYEQLVGDPGPRPIITFSDAVDGHTIEVRSYVNAQTSRGHEFRIGSATPGRVTVIAYQDRHAVLAVYYDVLSPTVRMTSN